ncbi:hypothetical protein Vretimale_2045 [Volvox reticuliferus]|nr:hypothetical protein Vretimale_2045 [Volvox reticuliferus]
MAILGGSLGHTISGLTARAVSPSPATAATVATPATPSPHEPGTGAFGSWDGDMCQLLAFSPLLHRCSIVPQRRGKPSVFVCSFYRPLTSHASAIRRQLAAAIGWLRPVPPPPPPPPPGSAITIGGRGFMHGESSPRGCATAQYLSPCMRSTHQQQLHPQPYNNPCSHQRSQTMTVASFRANALPSNDMRTIEGFPEGLIPGLEETSRPASTRPFARQSPSGLRPIGELHIGDEDEGGDAEGTGSGLLSSPLRLPVPGTSGTRSSASLPLPRISELSFGNLALVSAGAIVTPQPSPGGSPRSSQGLLLPVPEACSCAPALVPDTGNGHEHLQDRGRVFTRCDDATTSGGGSDGFGGTLGVSALAKQMGGRETGPASSLLIGSTRDGRNGTLPTAPTGRALRQRTCPGTLPLTANVAATAADVMRANPISRLFRASLASGVERRLLQPPGRRVSLESSMAGGADAIECHSAHIASVYCKHQDQVLQEPSASRPLLLTLLSPPHQQAGGLLQPQEHRDLQLPKSHPRHGLQQQQQQQQRTQGSLPEQTFLSSPSALCPSIGPHEESCSVDNSYCLTSADGAAAAFGTTTVADSVTIDVNHFMSQPTSPPASARATVATVGSAASNVQAFMYSGNNCMKGVAQPAVSVTGSSTSTSGQMEEALDSRDWGKPGVIGTWLTKSGSTETQLPGAHGGAGKVTVGVVDPFRTASAAARGIHGAAEGEGTEEEGDMDRVEHSLSFPASTLREALGSSASVNDIWGAGAISAIGGGDDGGSDAAVADHGSCGSGAHRNFRCQVTTRGRWPGCQGDGGGDSCALASAAGAAGSCAIMAGSPAALQPLSACAGRFQPVVHAAQRKACRTTSLEELPVSVLLPLQNSPDLIPSAECNARREAQKPQLPRALTASNDERGGALGTPGDPLVRYLTEPDGLHTPLPLPPSQLGEAAHLQFQQQQQSAVRVAGMWQPPKDGWGVVKAVREGVVSGAWRGHCELRSGVAGAIDHSGSSSTVQDLDEYGGDDIAPLQILPAVLDSGRAEGLAASDTLADKDSGGGSPGGPDGADGLILLPAPLPLCLPLIQPRREILMGSDAGSPACTASACAMGPTGSRSVRLAGLVQGSTLAGWSLTSSDAADAGAVESAVDGTPGGCSAVSAYCFGAGGWSGGIMISGSQQQQQPQQQLHRDSMADSEVEVTARMLVSPGLVGPDRPDSTGSSSSSSSSKTS